MPKIIYITSDGREHAVDAVCGMSAMQVAVDNRVPGIDGDCGGVAACGTCHVWVDEAWRAKLGAVHGEQEEQMLSLTDGRTANSRLACQITVSDELDGLVLRLPTAQH